MKGPAMNQQLKKTKKFIVRVVVIAILAVVTLSVLINVAVYSLLNH